MPERITPEQLAEIRQRNARAFEEICAIAEQGTSRWRMHIPAEPERDSDLVISSALADLNTIIEGMHLAEAEAVAAAMTLARAQDLLLHQDTRGMTDAEVIVELTMVLTGRRDAEVVTS